MITAKPLLRSGFDCIIRPAPSGAGRTTPSQPGHYPLSKTRLNIAFSKPHPDLPWTNELMYTNALGYIRVKPI